MSRFKPDPEIAKAKREAAAAALEAGVAAIHNSDDFASFLRKQARFHKYSFGNVMLILSQRPDATCVAGFRQWQAMNRQVRKGAKGITIIVPMTKKVEDAATGDVERKMFFGTGSVFDISDTDGEALDAGIEYTRISSETRVDLWPRIVAAVEAAGLKISMAADEPAQNGAYGFYRASERKIWIAPTLALDARCKTLLHEWAHSLDERQTGDHRGERETVAEGAAYVAAQYFALDTGDESFAYVAQWAASPATMKAALGEVQHIAAKMIDAIEAAVEAEAAA